MLSVALHALVLYLLAPEEQRRAWVPPTLPHVKAPPMTVVELLEMPAGGGVGEVRHVQSRHRVPKRSADAWEKITVRSESRHVDANVDVNDPGQGQGQGRGRGNGIGLGNGGGVRVSDDIPQPPPAPRVSKARPPILIWPTRNEDVDDESNLFVARVSLNRYGEVIGAHMLTARPGAKADRAANVIWTFRYTPALDDDGMPVKATLDQEFQIR